MNSYNNWQYDEFAQVGKDYGTLLEVEKYDATHASFRDVTKENNEILDLLQVNKGDTVVDFGTGTGSFAIQASARGAQVYGVDISSVMLDYAKDKAKSAGIDNIHFIQDGFLSYAHQGPPPKFVSTSFALHHLPDFWKCIALKRIYNMLANNGKLFIQDVVIEELNCIDNINTFIDAQFTAGGTFMKDDAIGHFRDEYSTYDWVMEQMLTKCGFKIITKEYTQGLICRYTCEK